MPSPKNYTIPLVCSFCEQPVDPGAPGVYKQVTAWTALTKRGDQGVKMASPPLAWAHRICLESPKVDPNQGGLF